MAEPAEPRETGDVDAILDDVLPPARTSPAPVGQAPALVRSWFADTLTAEIPVYGGTLSSARLSADAYASRAKSQNTRRAYVSGGHRQLGGWPACEMALSQVAGRDDTARCSQLRRLPLPG